MKAFKTWLELQAALRGANERQCERMLFAEQEGPCRPTFALRIYGRYSTLRKERERKEILKLCN